MRILQIDSAVVCGPEYVGKWYCSDSAQPVGDIPIIRYLQADGTWGKTTHYFGTKEEIEGLLETAGPPDFSVDSREAIDRQYWRDVEADLLYDDPFGEESFGGEPFGGEFDD